MLKFIEWKHTCLTEDTDFNTSHVKVYRGSGTVPDNGTKISIHPMLKFINDMFPLPEGISAISIHPMLKFISHNFGCQSCFCNFNTSHVKVYLVPRFPYFQGNIHFNTSHVKVYPVANGFIQKVFQYISC